MARAVDAAEAVRGLTSPNPWVGAVVVTGAPGATESFTGATAPPGGAHAEVVDVTDPAQVDRLATGVLDRHGRVDVVVNNVGDYRPLVRFEASGPESWSAM